MRTFIIGDIHGCFDELMELLAQAQVSDQDLLISLGDIVDRGNQSAEVYAFFKNRPNAVVLVGNHERKHQNGVLSYAQEIVKVQMGSAYTGFLQWIDTLGYYYETDEAIVVHAFFEHDKIPGAQKPEVLCGSTSGERYLEKKYPAGTRWNEHYTGAKPVIYGHHVVGERPHIFNNTYGIDTGCCHGQYLTAIELPGFHIHQVKAKKDYWKEEQKRWQVPVLRAKNWSDMDFAAIRQQLDQLAYIGEEETVRFLAGIKTWTQGLVDSYGAIKIRLDELAQDLQRQYGETFSTRASAYSFGNYLFKSRNGKLTLADLEKGLNTPAKVLDIQQQLGLREGREQGGDLCF